MFRINIKILLIVTTLILQLLFQHAVAANPRRKAVNNRGPRECSGAESRCKGYSIALGFCNPVLEVHVPGGKCGFGTRCCRRKRYIPCAKMGGKCISDCTKYDDDKYPNIEVRDQPGFDSDCELEGTVCCKRVERRSDRGGYYEVELGQIWYIKPKTGSTRGITQRRSIKQRGRLN